MPALRSSLAAHITSGDGDAAERARKVAKECYHETGIVLINPDWLPGWLERQQLIMLAEKVHGARRMS